MTTGPGAASRRRTWRRAIIAGVAAVVTGAAAFAVAQTSSRGARVEAIFPTADRLPANLLRFYIVFSAPMSTGEASARLRLVDEQGRVAAGAFLELEEELWDPSGRRLTVLLDPGRIKRGLRANLESGAPLAEGRRYRLEIDGAWRDGRGAPLASGAARTFVVTAADRMAPQVDAWELTPPPAGTRAPLVVEFPEPLDRALLASAMTVEAGDGAAVAGVVEVTDEERRWTFTPASPWARGDHQLRIGAELEDIAGNSLRRLFDTDLSVAPRASMPAVLRRAFVVRPAS